MTREAAKNGFEDIFDRTIEATRKEFSIGRALQGTGLGSAGVLIDSLRKNTDSLERRIIQPELDAQRKQMFDQFEIILNYAESSKSIEHFQKELIDSDPVLDHLHPNVSDKERNKIIEKVMTRNKRLGSGVESIIEQHEDNFWKAVESAYKYDDAIRLAEQSLSFTQPIRQHKSAFELKLEVTPQDVIGGPFVPGISSIEIDYTDEAARAMYRAEKKVIHNTKQQINSEFK